MSRILEEKRSKGTIKLKQIGKSFGFARFDNKLAYEVVSCRNTLNPKVGDILKENEVQLLIDGNYVVDITK